MTDWTPPFAENGDKRLPSNTEQSLGIACDTPQLRELFNGLYWLLQSNIKNVADEAGITPSGAGDKTYLFRAIDALIAAATGGGSAGDYILMTQARARLPIFPHVLENDGHLGVTAVSPGTIRVPGSKSFLHRGIYTVTTSQTDLNTDASKNYHLRWNPTDGFALKDLVGGSSYNPTSAAETNVAFDSTYDDMLVARVITNSGNVATITNLINKDRLYNLQEGSHNFGSLAPGQFAPAVALSPVTLNWARTGRHIPVPLGTHAPQGSIAGGMDIALGSGASMPGASFLPLQLDRYGYRVGLQAGNPTATTRTVTAAYEVHSVA